MAAGLLAVVVAIGVFAPNAHATHTERVYAGNWAFSIEDGPSWLGPASGTINFRWVEEGEGKTAIEAIVGEPPSDDPIYAGPDVTDCYGRSGAEYYVGTWTRGEDGGTHAGCVDSFHRGRLQSLYETREGRLGEFWSFGAGPSGFSGEWWYPNMPTRYRWAGEFIDHFAGDNAGEAARRGWRAETAFVAPGARRLLAVRAAGSGSFLRSGSTVSDGKGSVRLDFAYRRATRRAGRRTNPFVQLEVTGIRRAFETADGRGMMWNAVVTRSSFPGCAKGKRARVRVVDLHEGRDWVRYRGARGCGPRSTWQDGTSDRRGLALVGVEIQGDDIGCAAPATAPWPSAQASGCAQPSTVAFAVGAKRLSAARKVDGNLADARLGGAGKSLGTPDRSEFLEARGSFSLRQITDSPLLPDQDLLLRARAVRYAPIADPKWMDKLGAVALLVLLEVKKSDDRSCPPESLGSLVLVDDRAGGLIDGAYLLLNCARATKSDFGFSREFVWANGPGTRIPWLKNFQKVRRAKVVVETRSGALPRSSRPRAVGRTATDSTSSRLMP